MIKIYKHELRNNVKKLIYLSFSFLPIILWKLFCYSKGIGNDYVNLNILLNLLPRINNFDNYLLISYFLLLNEKFLYSLIFFSVIFWISWNKELFIFVFINAILYILILYKFNKGGYETSEIEVKEEIMSNSLVIDSQTVNERIKNKECI